MQSNSDEEQFKRKLAARFLAEAMGQGLSIPWQMAANLSETGLFDSPPSSAESGKEIVAALSAQQETARDSPSLFIAVRPQKPDSVTMVYEATDWLALPDLDVAAALRIHLEPAVRRFASVSQVSSLLDHYGRSIELKDMRSTMRAAAELDDALAVDWGWQVATLAHAWSRDLVEVINRQMTRLLGFDVADVSALGHFQREFNETIEALGRELPEEGMSGDVAEAWLGDLPPLVAHLPWGHGVGLPRVFDAASAARLPALWSRLEQWNDETLPAWWFHLWLTVMRRPEIVPDAIHSVLWRRVALLVSEQSKPPAEQSIEERSATLYSILFRFYRFRIESALPLIRVDFAAWYASKLTSDLVPILVGSDDPGLYDALQEAMNDAQTIWRLAAPSVVETPLRSALATFPTQWHAAVLASIQEWKKWPTVGEIPASSRETLIAFTRAAAAKLLVLSTGLEAQTEQLLVDELTELHPQWAEILGDADLREWCNQSDGLTRQLTSIEAITNRVGSPIDPGDAEGNIVLLKWLELVRTGKVAIDKTLETIKSDSWLTAVEPHLSSPLAEQLIFALVGAPWRGPETLRVDVAHWAAKLCLHYREDQPHRQRYFFATVLFSLKGATVSGVRRVIVQDKKNELLGERKAMSALLDRMLLAAPPWLCGRIRSVLATIEE